MGFGAPGDTERHRRVPTSLFQIKFHSPPGLLPSSHGMALKTLTEPPQRTKIRCPVRTLRAYATSSQTISKEFPEMLAKLQQIGMSIWLPRGTTWMGHCSLGCIKAVLTAPPRLRAVWERAHAPRIQHRGDPCSAGQAGRIAEVEVRAPPPGVLTLVLRLPSDVTGVPQFRMTKYQNRKKPCSHLVPTFDR